MTLSDALTLLRNSTHEDDVVEVAPLAPVTTVDCEAMDDTMLEAA